jgi:hypothetical protein
MSSHEMIELDKYNNNIKPRTETGLIEEFSDFVSFGLVSSLFLDTKYRDANVRFIKSRIFLIILGLIGIYGYLIYDNIYNLKTSLIYKDHTNINKDCRISILKQSFAQSNISTSPGVSSHTKFSTSFEWRSHNCNYHHKKEISTSKSISVSSNINVEVRFIAMIGDESVWDYQDENDKSLGAFSWSVQRIANINTSYPVDYSYYPNIESINDTTVKIPIFIHYVDGFGDVISTYVDPSPMVTFGGSNVTNTMNEVFKKSCDDYIISESPYFCEVKDEIKWVNLFSLLGGATSFYVKICQFFKRFYRQNLE